MQAVSAGSVGPWQPGGISAFQVNSGRTLAQQAGRPYQSFAEATLPANDSGKDMNVATSEPE